MAAQGRERGNIPRYVIAIDYGTTYTGVAWVITTGDAPPRLSDINVVQNWVGGIGPKVPSLLTYSANDREQWGFDIGNNAYVIRWTKLQLEPPTRYDALRALRQTLSEAVQLAFNDQNIIESQIPRHLIKTSADIVSDYLREVAACVRHDIESKRDPATLVDFPIDLVITHPAVWHPRAQNITFRAVTDAFRQEFPEMEVRPGHIRLATEPEACAQYTMRVAQDENMGNLRKGECFVVVDAGGGTVDLVSYRIDSLSPFKMTRVTEVSGGGYGATRVDDYFLKIFLRRRLSPADYQKLMDFGGEREQHGMGAHVVLREGQQLLLKHFEIVKHTFQGPPAPGDQPQDNLLDLPNEIGLEDSPERGIMNGQLIITYQDMEEMFRESVQGTRDLITQQLVQLDRLGLKARTVFLSGGFSRSAYLYRSIQELTRRWKFLLLRGDDSWTAVVKGAILMGLGLGCEAPPVNTPCPFHIGVVLAKPFTEYDHDSNQIYTDSFDGVLRAKDNINWVISRGDLITPAEGIQKNIKIIRRMPREGTKPGSLILVTSTYDDPRGPKRNFSLPDYTRAVHRLDYDFSSLNVRDQQSMYVTETDPKTRATYRKVVMQLEINVTQREIVVELVTGKTVDFLGNTGASGFRLKSLTIPFPES